MASLATLRIAFCGAGNMAESLIAGLIKGGCKSSHIAAFDPCAERLEYLQERYRGMRATDSNRALLDIADVVVIAVKPQSAAAVLADFAGVERRSELLWFSIVAGLRYALLQRFLGAKSHIVRCMPNTPAVLGHAASALYSGASLTFEQRQQAELIAASAGFFCWVEQENLLDVVTALSGSGPAYCFQFMESLCAEATALGLDPETAQSLCAHTLWGAALMALQEGAELPQLRRAVTSPGGTTEHALALWDREHIPQQLRQGLRAAFRRAQELGEQLDKER